MKWYYIYKYINKGINPETNLINNKIYVGQCFNINHRKKAHKSSALRGSDSCPLFYRAIRQYGYENFDFEIIETIFTDQKGIDEREIYWIKELNARNSKIGYNLSKGGGGRGRVENDAINKYCPRCKKTKPRTKFTKNRSSHDGIRFCCQMCGLKIDREIRAARSELEKERRNKVRRDAYAANPELFKAQVKKYYEEHKEERAEYKKEYYQENKEELAAEHKIYRLEHKEEIAQQSKETRQLIKEDNSKLTAQQIYNRTPLKFCHGTCQKDIESNKFYIDLTRLDALGRKCKECHKAKMAINREKKRNELKVID